MSEQRLRFTPAQRLHTPAEYEAVYRHKYSAGDAVLLVFIAQRHAGSTRLGTSVGKRCGNSVARHAIKRAIREGFRQLQHVLPTGLDVVVVPRPGVTLTTVQVVNSLPKLVSRAARKSGQSPPSSS